MRRQRKADPTMAAMQIHRFGGVEVLRLERVPIPMPRADYLLVKVKALSINPIDWKTRRGDGVAHRIKSLPAILGWDISGVVADKGRRVSRFEIDDQIFGMVNFPDGSGNYAGGGYAQYVCVHENHIVHKPPTINHPVAAAAPLASLAAWQALVRHARLQAGERVLISGAAGGVGHIAVQLAKWLKAEVIGLSREHNIPFLESLGIDRALDYSDSSWYRKAGRFDVILNVVDGAFARKTIKLLKPSGRMISLANDAELPQSEAIRAIDVRSNLVDLYKISKLLDQAVLTLTINKFHSLRNIPNVHIIGERGQVRGKLIVLL